MTTKHIGQVKWFNNKIGYGFITLIEGNKKVRDIFVHHQNIQPLESNYRTLKLGEYVHFSIDDIPKSFHENTVEGEHKEQAISVTGINGLELQCDFLYRNNLNKKQRKKD